MKPKKIHRRLMDGLDSGRIVTVVRDAFEYDVTDGFLLSVTEDWLVMQSLSDGVYLDGITILRLEDISRVRFRDDDAYHHRAIAGLGTSPASFTCDETASVRDLLAAASDRADIFAVHLEALHPSELSIGRLIRLRANSFEMHYVGRDGVWAKETERWKYRDLTRIEVGGRYLDALNRFADAVPEEAEAPEKGLSEAGTRA